MTRFPTPPFRDPLDVLLKLCFCIHLLSDALKVFYTR